MECYSKFAYYDGLFPAICAKKNIAKLFYPSCVKTYLEKDVRDLLKIKDIMQFLKFMKLCAARVGSVFNASELANCWTSKVLISFQEIRCAAIYSKTSL